MSLEIGLGSFTGKLASLGAVTVVVYDSEARGNTMPDSDIDLLVILQEYYPDVMRIISKTAFETSLAVGRKISVEVYSMEDFQFMVKE